MRLVLRPLAVAAVAAAAAPGAASAADWSAPQDLSTAHLFIDRPRLLATGNGAALATWAWTDGTGADGRTGTSLASRPRPAAGFGPATPLAKAQRIDRGETVAPPVAFGRRGVIVAGTGGVGAVAAQRSRLSVRFGTVDGRLGRRTVIRTAPGIRSVQLAASDDGAAALAWFEDRGVRNDHVYVALRRPGHGFGRPRPLATGRIRSVATAVGTSGAVLVTWDARGTIKARFRPHGRRSFAPTERIRTADPAFFAELHPVVTADGRAAIAWSAQFQSEGGDSGPVYFEVAVRTAGARHFRPAQQLERLGDEVAARPIDAVESDGGRIVVAWSGSFGTTRRVAVEQIDGARGHELQYVSPEGSDALLSDLAADPAGGGLIAVWDNGSFGADQVFAALAPGGGEPFGPPEAVSPDQEARDGHAVFDPRTHQPTVVWTNRPAGSAMPPARIRTFAQAATRSG